MTRPARIQLRRRRGWCLPSGARSVARPHRWGNPHPVGEPCPACAGAVHTQAEAVVRYRQDLAGDRELVAAARRELAGKDLACWCRLDQPCHADVLLEIANS